MYRVDFCQNAPFVVCLANGDVILARRIDDVDRRYEESQIVKTSFRREPGDLIINNSDLLNNLDIENIISPMDNVIGELDDSDIEGSYIGIDPIQGQFIVVDTSGIEHNVISIQPEILPEPVALKSVLKRMRKVIDSMKEAPEITPDLKDNLEGNLEEIYLELDAGIEDE